MPCSLFDTTTYVEEEYEEEQDYGEMEGEEFEGGGETVTRTRQVRKEVEAHEFGPLAATASSKTVYDYEAEAQALASSGGDVDAAMALLMADAEPQRQSVVEARLLQHLLINESDCSHAALTMLEAVDVLEECGADVRGAVAKVEGNPLFRERSDINKITDALAKQGLSVRPPRDEIRAELYRADGDYDTALAATLKAWSAHEAAYDQVADMLSVTGKWRPATHICAALVATSFDAEAAAVELTGIDDFATRIFPHAKVKHLLRDRLEYVYLEQSEIEAALTDSGGDIASAFEALLSQLKAQQKLFQLKEQLMQRLPWADVPLSALRQALGKADQDMSRATSILYETWCNHDSKFQELARILGTVGIDATSGVMCAALVKTDFDAFSAAALASGLDDFMQRFLNQHVRRLLEQEYGHVPVDDETINKMIVEAGGEAKRNIDEDNFNRDVIELLKTVVDSDRADQEEWFMQKYGGVKEVAEEARKAAAKAEEEAAAAAKAKADAEQAARRAREEEERAAERADKAKAAAAKAQAEAAAAQEATAAAQAVTEGARQELKEAEKSGDPTAISEAAEKLKAAQEAAKAAAETADEAETSANGAANRAERDAQAATDAVAASEEADDAVSAAQEEEVEATTAAEDAQAAADQADIGLRGGLTQGEIAMYGSQEANKAKFQTTVFKTEVERMGFWNFDHPEVAVMVVGVVLDKKGGAKLGGATVRTHGVNYDDWSGKNPEGVCHDCGDRLGTFSVLAQQQSTILLEVIGKDGSKPLARFVGPFETQVAGTELDVGAICMDALLDPEEAKRLAELAAKDNARLTELTGQMKEIFKVLEVWRPDIEIASTIVKVPAKERRREDYDLTAVAEAITGEVGVMDRYRRILVRKALTKLLRVDLGQDFQETLIEESAIEAALRSSSSPSLRGSVEDATEAVRTSILRAIEEQRRQAEMRKMLGTINAAIDCIGPLLLDGNDLTGAKTLEKLSELRISAEEENRPIEVVRMMEMELYTQLQATAAAALAGRDSLRWRERWRDTYLDEDEKECVRWRDDGQLREIYIREDDIARFVSEAVTALMKKYSFVVATRTRNDDFDSARFWARKAEFLSVQAELFQEWVGRLRLRAVTLTNSGSLLRKQSQLVPAAGVLGNAAQIWKDAVQKAQKEGEEMSPEGASLLQRDAGLATFVTYSAVLSAAGNHQGAFEQAQTALSTAYKLASVSGESTYDAKFKALPAELNQAVVAACFCAGTARKALEAAPATRGAKARTSVEWFRRGARISREAFGAKHVVTSSLTRRSKLQEPKAEDRLPGHFFISYKEIEPGYDDEDEEY
eukprot:COSAG04_NODE_257_length_18753_cov_7.516857_3_plen_1322_part_00